MIINLKEFPVTRYQGSKRKLVSWIYEVIKETNLQFDTVLDGFGGTASVSYLFKKMGKTVTYNDNLRFNHLIGKALIENNSINLLAAEIDELYNFVSTTKIVQNNFQDIYYIQDENQWIDNIAQGIETIFGSKGSSENEHKHAIAYYALFQACLIKRPFNLFHRKNLNLRLNDVERNFGNKTSWEKPFDELFKKFANEAGQLAFDNGRVCQSLHSSVFELDAHEFDLVYFDPPYFVEKNDHETSNYFKCYHFLEGLSNYGTWGEMINYESKNKRLNYPASDLTLTRHNMSEKMEVLLEKYRNSTIIFSYKEGGVPSISFFENLLKKLNKKVFTKSIHYKYALNHQNGDALKNREVLIIGL